MKNDKPIPGQVYMLDTSIQQIRHFVVDGTTVVNCPLTIFILQVLPPDPKAKYYWIPHNITFWRCDAIDLRNGKQCKINIMPHAVDKLIKP